jgi:hypothetical protein
MADTPPGFEISPEIVIFGFAVTFIKMYVLVIL